MSCQNTLISPFAHKSQCCLYYCLQTATIIHGQVQTFSPSFSQLLQRVRYFWNNLVQMSLHTILQACCQLFLRLAKA